MKYKDFGDRDFYLPRDSCELSPKSHFCFERFTVIIISFKEGSVRQNKYTRLEGMQLTTVDKMNWYTSLVSAVRGR